MIRGMPSPRLLAAVTRLEVASTGFSPDQYLSALSATAAELDAEFVRLRGAEIGVPTEALLTRDPDVASVYASVMVAAGSLVRASIEAQGEGSVQATVELLIAMATARPPEDDVPPLPQFVDDGRPSLTLVPPLAEDAS